MQNLKNIPHLIFSIIIITLAAGTAIHIFAAFSEPAAAPASSNQDFTENILGANNADNDFDSSAVTASGTGSIIERLEYISDKMYQIQDWPGRGWQAEDSGDATTSLTREACEAAANWEWFEDGNGDGDYLDPEDGVCVKTTTRVSDNWGGTETNDNTYIMDYDCTGSFPNGTTTPAAANSCALCVADCYDGRKDLPDQGAYTAPDTSCDGSNEGCYSGPLTPEVLKNWKGTKLPTADDFFGFCGYKDGGSNYETGCSADTNIGAYGGMVGRIDKCLDLSGSSNYEWLSEQINNNNARVAGNNACSNSNNNNVNNGNRFRAVFRP